MEAANNAAYSLIENLLPQDEVGFGYTDDLLSFVHAHAREESDPSLTSLPILCCQATDGDVHQAIPVAAAWRLLHLAAQVLDDVEDRELDRTFWVSMSTSQTLNAATGLIFAAQLALSGLPRLGVPASLALALLDDFGRTTLRVCAGQHADLAAQNGANLSLEQYQAIVAAKSGDCFALACRAGAMLGTKDSRRVAHYTEFGYNLGVLVQISDDLVGLQESGQRNDLAAGQQTLPILYALSVAPPKQQVVLRELLLKAPGDVSAEAEARQTIISLGALAYLLIEAQVHRRRAKHALQATGRSIPAHKQLLTLVDQVMPGSSLIHSVGDTKDDYLPQDDRDK
jgi:competence protein ComQ